MYVKVYGTIRVFKEEKAIVGTHIKKIEGVVDYNHQHVVKLEEDVPLVWIPPSRLSHWTTHGTNQQKHIFFFF